MIDSSRQEGCSKSALTPIKISIGEPILINYGHGAMRDRAPSAAAFMTATLKHRTNRPEVPAKEDCEAGLNCRVGTHVRNSIV